VAFPACSATRRTSARDSEGRSARAIGRCRRTAARPAAPRRSRARAERCGRRRHREGTRIPAPSRARNTRQVRGAWKRARVSRPGAAPFADSTRRAACPPRATATSECPRARPSHSCRPPRQLAVEIARERSSATNTCASPPRLQPSAACCPRLAQASRPRREAR